MAATGGDDKQEPSLELPTLKLPGLGRRKRSAPSDEDQAPDKDHAPAPAQVPATVPPSKPGTAAPPVEPPPAAEDTPEKRSRPSAPSLPPALPALPSLPGRAAAAVTGVVVGLVAAVGTVGAMAGCEAVRGVSSCGGAPGFFVLVALLVLMVLLGSVLLRALGVDDPGSTSFLAVGVVAVVVMLALLDVVFSPWMFVVVPLLGALAFLLAHWVTTRFDDEATGRRDWT